MKTSVYKIKKEALRKIKPHFFALICIFAAYYLIGFSVSKLETFIVSHVGWVFDGLFLFALSAFILVPLSFGTYNYILSIFKKTAPNIKDVLAGFKYKNIPFFLTYAFMLWIQLFIVKNSSVGRGLNTFFYSNVGILMNIFMIILSLLYIYVSIKVSFSMLIAIEDPKLKVKEIISRSFYLLKGNTWRYICLYLSFIIEFIIMFIVLVILFGFFPHLVSVLTIIIIMLLGCFNIIVDFMVVKLYLLVTNQEHIASIKKYECENKTAGKVLVGQDE